MKKTILFLFLCLFIIPIKVSADSIYKIDMDIYIDEYGNAKIEETWIVKASGGT